MLGHTLFRGLAKLTDLNVTALVRSNNNKTCFANWLQPRIISGCDVTKSHDLSNLFEITQPDIVINCVSSGQANLSSKEFEKNYSILALLPHRLAALCQIHKTRLIHVSTDGVFSGDSGNYTEQSIPDARDQYGKLKAMGELTHSNTITLRTSIIGHELVTRKYLLEWFLLQEEACRGYTGAIFTGITTLVLSRVIIDHIIPKSSLNGIYHVATDPITKYELLQIIAKIYKKNIKLIPDNRVVIDRSLNASKFMNATGYRAPDWLTLVESMHSHQRGVL